MLSLFAQDHSTGMLRLRRGPRFFFFLLTLFFVGVGPSTFQAAGLLINNTSGKVTITCRICCDPFVGDGGDGRTMQAHQRSSARINPVQPNLWYASMPYYAYMYVYLCPSRLPCPDVQTLPLPPLRTNHHTAATSSTLF